MFRQGQFIGEEDVINKRARTTTMTCMSRTGILLRMRADEFFKRLQTHEETWAEIKYQLYFKEKNVKERTNMITKIYEIKPSDVIADATNAEYEKIAKEEEKAAQLDPNDLFAQISG